MAGDVAVPDTGVRLEQAKWHLARYDGLHATAAGKASTVLSANALILAGTTVLIGQFFGGWNGRMDLLALIVAGGCAASFIFVGLSVVKSAQGLLALTPWRKRFGQEVPIVPFFQHNETLRLLPTCAEFSRRFKACQSRKNSIALL